MDLVIPGFGQVSPGTGFARGRCVLLGLKVFCGARAFRFVVFDDSPDLTNCQIRQILTNPHYILCTKSPVICRIHFGKFVRALVNFSMRAGSA